MLAHLKTAGLVKGYNPNHVCVYTKLTTCSKKLIPTQQQQSLQIVAQFVLLRVNFAMKWHKVMVHMACLAVSSFENDSTSKSVLLFYLTFLSAPSKKTRESIKQCHSRREMSMLWTSSNDRLCSPLIIYSHNKFVILCLS